MNSGIYKISNVVNGKIYIGATKDFRIRWNVHKSDLALGTHCNNHLQHSYNKHGLSNFKFDILLRCDLTDLVQIEQYFLDFYQPEYNILKVAGFSTGYKHTEESKKKISIGHKGKKHSLLRKRKRGKPILQICSKTNDVLNEFFTVREAGLTINVAPGTICAVAKGKRKTAGGFVWKYKS
jgi:group I intron endonuclease